MTIGVDDAKSRKNTNLSVIMCVRLFQKIGLHNLTYWNQLKEGNGYKKCMKSNCDYFRIHLMLHTRILLLREQKFRPTGDMPDFYQVNESNTNAKLFDTGFTCDGNLYTYVYNVLSSTSIILFYVFLCSFCVPEHESKIPEGSASARL